MLGTLASPVIRWACAPRAHAFARALDDMAGAQSRVLARIVDAASGTGYGRSLGLAAGDGLDAFRRKVPIVGYEAVQPWIAAQRAGRDQAFAPGRTRCFEPTSGSSGAMKLIPYNDALLRSFRGLFAIWAHDLLSHALRLRSGRTFMSVSAAHRAGEGFADDGEYLGPALRALVGRFLVAPPRERDPAAFRDALALALMAAHDLEIISVWNPSYLLVLMEHVEAHRARLLPLLPGPRRELLARDPVPWSEVWPSLQLVSCWTAAAAAAPARVLAQRFPQARLQGKGLLATEAPVTVPLIGAGGCVPLVDEVFIELEGDDGQVNLCSEAEEGACYSVVVTQPGGLLRYRLGDRVRVVGRHRCAPLLEFVGRADAVSDLVGEKLSEAFVDQALRSLLRPDAVRTLLPVLPEAGRPRYCLMTDCGDAGLAAALDRALMGAFRYREARLLGQLDAVQVTALPDMRRRLHDALASAGFKAGDIKDRALIPNVGLARQVHACIAGSAQAGVDLSALVR